MAALRGLALRLVLFAPLALAGCGSSDELQPAAEPATSPPLTRAPAGKVVRVGSGPEGLVADPRTGLVAVGLRNPDRLALVDGSSGRIERRVRLPESPRHLQLAASGGPVLVPAERADALLRVSLPGGRLSSAAVGAFPHDAAAAAGRLFVADERGDTVTVLAGRRRIRTLPAPVQPGGVAAAGGKVAVVAVGERVLEVFDARTLRSLGRASAGVGPTHVVALGERIYVVDTSGDALLEFRLEPQPVLKRRIALLGSPYGVAVDPRRRRLWVTLTARNRVVEVDPDDGPLRRRPTVRQPNSVAVDPRSGRVYVASLIDGTLQIIDVDRRRAPPG